MYLLSIIIFVIVVKTFEISGQHAQEYVNEVTKRELLPEPYEESSDQDLNNWQIYLEENAHALFGSNTPILIAKFNPEVEYIYSPNHIKYERVSWSISDAQEIEHTVLHSNVRILRSIDNSETNKFSNAFHKTKSHPEKNEEVLYLKVLVTIDYFTYEFYKYDITMITTYISSLLNGVDLKLRQMSNPKIRLNIAGIIIPKDPGVTFYLNHYSVGDMKNAKMIIYDMDHYFQKLFPKNICDFDIVLGIVENDMVYDNRFARVSASNKSNLEKGQFALVVSTDDGHLGSLLPITKAIGRIIGAPYNETTDNYDDSCLRNENLMKNGSFWSECSLQSMRNFLSANEKLKKRLGVKPDVGTPLTKKLPGKLYNRNEQCKSISRDSIANDNKENCLKLECHECAPFTGYLQENIGSKYFCTSSTENTKSIPADGSACGVGKMCLNGQCVHETTYMTPLT